jgi:hypothetical protein
MPLVVGLEVSLIVERTPTIKNSSLPPRLGAMRVESGVGGKSQHPDSKMPNNASKGSIEKKPFGGPKM